MTSDFALNLRPKTFESICGQKTIIDEMKKRSLTNDFPTVMIFAGASGTGKTTLACLIGALINDPNPLDGNGCKNPNPESPEYKSVYEETYNRNVCFYDASKMGKEDVIALESVVGTQSMFGGKKVLIIDEAQELGRYSKGAVLKLLEKKRKDTHIILCTMSPESFDKAIRSRGQFYSFKSPTSIEIAEYLYSLSVSEGIDLPDDFLTKGIFTVAENCEGSVRMAVQTFERCLKAELYTPEQIQAELGFLSSDDLSNIVMGLVQKKANVIETLAKMEMKEFFTQSFKYIQDVLVYLRTGFAYNPNRKRYFADFRPYKEELNNLFKLYAEIDRYCSGYFQSGYVLTRLTEVLENPIKIR